VAVHAGVTVMLGLAAIKLCRRCALTLGKLRLLELLIFGCPTILFVILMYEKLTISATLLDSNVAIPQTVGSWLMLIFTYALFIPNTWQRALAVLAAIGAMPLIVNIATLFIDPKFHALAQL